MSMLRISSPSWLPLALLASLGAACETLPPPSATGPTITTPSRPNAGLPFDPLDPNATYAAKILVENRAGEHPAASVTYAGTTYSTDTAGVISIPAVKMSDLGGVRITATGYMPRSVVLEYRRVSTDKGLRVVLEKPGVVTSFNSATPAQMAQGPMVIGFPANGFKSASGQPYTGVVTAAGFGFDPVASALTMDNTGLSLRKDFDLDRVPQGYGVATDVGGIVHFLLPESLFQVELSDEAGAPLQLNGTTPATYAFRLSGASQHKLNEVVTTYTFDEKLQRWVADGTCTVKAMADGGLACAGETTHFSSWMVASGADSNNLACANLSLRYKLHAGETVVGLDAPRACGQSSATSAEADPCLTPEVQSTSGTCFYQSKPFSDYTVTVRTETTTAGVKTERRYTVRWNAASGQMLRLVSRGGIKASELSQTSLDSTCGECPTTRIDLDLTVLTPDVTPPVLVTCDCKGTATCSASGACQCPSDATYSKAAATCVKTSCMSPLVLNTTQNTCDQPAPNLCANNGTCTALQTCSVETATTGGSSAKCTWKTCQQAELLCAEGAACVFDATTGPACKCNAGFMGDGTTSCTFITDMASAADMGQPPADMFQPPADMFQPPADLAQPPADMFQPPADMFQPPMDFGQGPMDFGFTDPDLGFTDPDLGFTDPDLGFGGPDFSFGGPDLSFGGPPDIGV